MSFKNRAVIIGAALAALAGMSGHGTLDQVRHGMAAGGKVPLESQKGTPTAGTHRHHKGGRFFGFAPKRWKGWKYGKGLPVTVAQQKRISRKARNVKRHKRHCGQSAR